MIAVRPVVGIDMLKEQKKTFSQQVKHDKDMHDYYARRREIMFNMPFGKERRTAILSYIRDHAISSDSYYARIWINRRYCPVLKHDEDLKKLIKSGEIVVKNQRTNDHVKRQYVTLAM